MENLAGRYLDGEKTIKQFEISRLNIRNLLVKYELDHKL